MQRSKCLPQCDEELSGFDARYGIEVVTDVDADRADRSLVAQSEPDGVGVIGSEVMEADVLEDVAAIVEGGETEVLVNDWEIDVHRDAKL